MNLRFILFLSIFLFFAGSTSFAQKLKSTAFINPDAIGLRSCATRDPGTVSFGPIVGESNNSRPDTIFLCYNDQIFVKNNGDGDFNDGDPNPLTPAAAGYLLYGCPPAVTGTTFANIQGDCVLSNPPPPVGELWYFMGTPNGDITLVNDGSVNATHNNGAPFTLYLAPATFDAFTLLGGEYYGQYENGGSCVKVNTSAAFPVVYLNQITINDFVTTSPTAFSGSFNITGGFPEFNGSANYTVDMFLKSNPNTKANLFGLPSSNGSQVSFATPGPGTYVITISDGRSCTYREEVVLPQGTVEVNVESGMVAMNDIICLDLTVKDFDDLLGGSFVISWNPTLLEFDQVTVPAGNPMKIDPTDPSNNIGFGDINLGMLRFIWTANPLTGLTLPDNEVIMSICFKAIGPPGTKTPVKIISTPSIPAEFIDDFDTGFKIKTTEGIVMITNPATLQVFLNVCSTTGNTGSVTFTTYGPAAQYNYSFDNATPSFVNAGVPFTISNLAPGSYELDVFPPVGPHVIITVVIANAPPIDVVSVLTPPKCLDAEDGNIQITPSGGVPPYSIEWSTFDFNINTLEDLGNGVYNVTITDDLGCIFTESYTLFTAPMGLSPATIVDPTCSGQKNGSITVQANGGNPKPGATYDYHWSDNTNQIGVATGTLMNISEGTYEVTVTDANGCEITSTFEILPGITIDATVQATEPVCYGDGTGQIIVTGTTDGSTAGPYTFSWEAAAGTAVNTSTKSTVSNLNGGIYDVIISDAAGCMITKTIDLTGPGEITFLLTGKVNDNCSGAPAGAITIFDGSGNTIPFPDPNNPGNGFYRFTWSNGSNPTVVDAVSLQLNNLAGSGEGIRYYVTITGVDGCTADTSFLIFKKDAPTITFDTLVPISCAGGNNGVIMATLETNGSEISTVTWSNNAGLPVNTGDTKTTYFSTVSNLSGGDYIITVNTLSGCEIKDTVTIIGQGSIDVIDEVIVPATCPNKDDGSIVVTTSGGTPPYDYVWSNGPTTPDNLNLTIGSYIVTITDDSGCPPLIDTFVVTSAPSIASGIDLNTIVASDCFEAVVGSGSASVFASGGAIGTYTFTWTSGETNTGVTSTAVQLKGGWQYVTISDGNCDVIDSVFIPSPPAISANKATASFSDVTCFGDADGTISFTATGGNGGYSYNWNPGNPNSSSINSLGAGTYYVTITDSKNCIGKDSFIIDEPTELIALSSSTLTHDVNCFGETSGAIGIDVTGGNGGNTFAWNPALAGNVSSANNLPAGNYLISVTDSKGCTDEVAVVLAEPAQLSVDFGPVPEPQCAGFPTNFEINNINGGVGPDYMYTIDQGQSYTTFEIAQVTGGNHVLTITDENGCTLDSSFTVKEPTPILVNLPEDVIINLGDSVLLSPVVLSAFPIGTTTWSPAGAVTCTTCDDTYAISIGNQIIVVVVEDVNGCTGTDSILVRVDKTRKIFIPNAFSPNKDGINDEFQVFTGPGVEKVMYLRVFDRFGALVYEQKNLEPSEYGTTNGWDGSYRGKYLDPAVFTYVSEISFLDGKTQLYFGSVTLVR